MPDGVRLPGATWKPFTARSVSSTPWTGQLTVILHTIVGSRDSAWNHHNQVGKPYVQLYYDHLGVPIQVTGLEYRASGTLELNPYVIAIENADYGPGFPQWDLKCGHVPPFTEAQVQALIRDLTWMFLRFGGEPTLMGETCLPLGGIGWHRLGIDPWRQPGCLEGSLSEGKCCPDDERIDQIVTRIQPEVARLVAEARNPTPAPVPEPEEDDMGSYERIIKAEGKSAAYLRGETATLIVNASTISNLEADGVEVTTVTPGDHDKIVQNLNGA